MNMTEKCAICGCELHRKKDTYARPSAEGRSHASRHHYVAERFFGRSVNRRGTQRGRIFDQCPWNVEGQSVLFCYDCHEELLHNPILLPDDIYRLATIVKKRGLDESNKPDTREKIAGRIKLLHEIISCGLKVIEKE